ncbi:MAG: LPS export ABC transporter periplasmic protein LptC [Rhizobiaceae bacterium]|nr:LPS export ABC transporter periplasmic protein LptC [Rhizobiaceae bacterium]
MNTVVPQIMIPKDLEAQLGSANVISERELAANVGHSGQDFMSSTREPGEFERALRHSGKVRRLKVILPIIAIVVVLGFVGAIALRSVSLPNISIGSLDLSDGKLVMKNPKLNGVDGKQRPYNLVAEKAIQDLSKPGEIELESIIARLPMDDGVFANVTAVRGIYNSEKRTLTMIGEVTMKTETGLDALLYDVDMDIASGSLQTSKPVSLKSESADIFADSMQVERNGEYIIFEKRVRLTLYPSAIQENENAQADGEQ